MKKFIFLALLSTASLLSTAVVRYVKPTASGLGNGSSWANASGDLQQMMNELEAIGGGEIWVAAGFHYSTQKPIPSANNRNVTFLLKANVKIYGGFLGNETELSQRNWKTHETILNGMARYHAVTAVGDVGSAVLDGFIIQLAQTEPYSTDPESSIIVNGYTIYNRRGAGITIHGSAPVLMNLIIRNNHAVEGAGIYIADGASPTIVNTVIHSNTTSPGTGGGIKCVNSFFVLMNSTIAYNKASDASGGIYNINSNPTIHNSIVYGNSTGEIVNQNSSPLYGFSLIKGVTTRDTKGNLDGNFNPYFLNTNPNNLDLRLDTLSPYVFV